MTMMRLHQLPFVATLFVLSVLGCYPYFSLGFVLTSSTRASLTGSTRLKATTDGSSIELIEPETGCEVVLLGCFHGAQSSAADVEASFSMDENKTNVIVLELCASRFADLRRDFLSSSNSTSSTTNAIATATSSTGRPWIQRWAKMVQKKTRARGLSTGAAAAVLGGITGLQTALSGLQPGLEFTTALGIAIDRKYDIVLADQLVDDTLHKIGNLPSISLSMWRDSFKQNSWKETFGTEASALNTALFGDGNNHVTLPGFLTRNGAAIRDLFRLAVPPLILLQTAVLGMSQAWSMLLDQPEPTLAAAAATTTDPSSSAPFLAINLFFVVLGYMSIALPATRVILRERDECLTKSIQSACRLAAEQSPDGKGRVVAVLGLLHVNGVAQRLAAGETKDSSQSINQDVGYRIKNSLLS